MSGALHGAQVRAGAPVSQYEIVKFAQLFNDELTLDNLERIHLVNLCRFVGIQPFGTDAFLVNCCTIPTKPDGTGRCLSCCYPTMWKTPLRTSACAGDSSIIRLTIQQDPARR